MCMHLACSYQKYYSIVVSMSCLNILARFTDYKLNVPCLETISIAISIVYSNFRYGN